MTEPTVQLARILTGAKSFKDRGIANLSDTYRGQILLKNGDVKTAIIKDIPVRELANEVMTAALAAAVSLPVPPAYIALVEPAILRTRFAPKLGTSALVFASADVNSPSVAQLLLGQSFAVLQTIAAMLVKSGWLGDFYGFDAWAANVDRHVGNLLVSPSSAPWLIDHGRCFTGQNWQASDLTPNGDFRNRLKEWLTPLLDSGDQKRFAGEAAALVDRLNKIDIKALGNENRLPALLGDTDFDAMVTFLDDRRVHVPSIAASALNQAMVI